MNTIFKIALTITLGLFVSCATAGTGSKGSITILAPYARATVPGQDVGAAYMVIENSGSATDRLLGVKSGAASDIEMHITTTEQGVSRMKMVPSLEIPAQGRLELKPGGLHLMLMGLKAPLKAGTSVSMTLRFEHAGSLDVTVPVK
jgi:copper(I)-binding protein